MSPKLWVVIRREFVATVWRKGWIIGTLAMPLIVALYALVVSSVIRVSERRESRPATFGLVDSSGLVRLPEGGRVEGSVPREVEEMVSSLTRSPGMAMRMGEMLGNATFRPYPDEKAGMAALEAGEISTLYIVPRDYLDTGSITSYSTGGTLTGGREGKGREALRRIIAGSLLEGKVEPSVRDRILQPVRLESFTKARDGSWEKTGLRTVLRAIAVPAGFMVLLIVTLLGSAGLLLQGLSEEKENRVIEVILSSVDAHSLLLGKLLGLGGAGLLQLAVWLAMAVAPMLLLAAGMVLQPGLVLLCLVYYVLGFLLYGTLITGTGVLGTNFRESNQLGMFWAIGSAVPAVFMETVLAQPNGTAARILSFIPLTAPSAMMLRLGSGEVASWEVVVSALVLAASIWVALRLVGRIFRTALLMYGKRPSPLEVLRWLRQA